MPDPVIVDAPLAPARAALLFHRLSEAQVARVAAHGSMRRIRAGELIIEVGDPNAPFFVVTEGRIEILRPFDQGLTRIATHAAGQFNGEGNMLLGRPSMTRARATEDATIVQLSRDRLLALIQTDSEISELVMKAFIYR